MTRHTFNGHIADVNRALSRVLYRPDVHYNTVGRPLSTVAVTVSNSHAALGGTEPVAVTATAVLLLAVSAVNDAPRVVLPAATAAMNEDASLVLAPLQVSTLVNTALSNTSLQSIVLLL
jgi:hypothetical protein